MTARDCLAFVLFGALLWPTCLARRLAPWLWPAFTGTLDEAAGVKEQKNETAIRLLRSWREGDEQEQRETWECLGFKVPNSSLNVGFGEHITIKPRVRQASAKCQDATAKCQDAIANHAARVMYTALGRIGDEAAAAIETESVMDDKQALAVILRECQEALC